MLKPKEKKNIKNVWKIFKKNNFDEEVFTSLIPPNAHTITRYRKKKNLSRTNNDIMCLIK